MRTSPSSLNGSSCISGSTLPSVIRTEPVCQLEYHFPQTSPSSSSPSSGAGVLMRRWSGFQWAGPGQAHGDQTAIMRLNQHPLVDWSQDMCNFGKGLPSACSYWINQNYKLVKTCLFLVLTLSTFFSVVLKIIIIIRHFGSYASSLTNNVLAGSSCSTNNNKPKPAWWTCFESSPDMHSFIWQTQHLKTEVSPCVKEWFVYTWPTFTL